VSKNYPLQRTWAQGINGADPTTTCTPGNGACFRSWGAPVNGTTTYDHANEAFDTGQSWDNSVTVSGGTDRTTFYGSGSFLKDNGPFVGPNNEFQRASARINGSQRLTDRLELRINGAYADTRGKFTQRGNNTNGLLLGLLRTPPNFNNKPYLDPATGQHRSYRFPEPQAGDEAADRGFSNPLFELNVPENSSTVGRVFGNLGLDYSALSWLRFNYTLGADYSNDERLEGAPLDGTGPTAGGRVTEGSIVNFSLDHNLTGTADWRVSENFAGTVTLGQNLNIRNNRQFSVVGRGLVAPQPYRLANTINRDLPIDVQTNIHNESYFGQATLDIANQALPHGRHAHLPSFPRAACTAAAGRRNRPGMDVHQLPAAAALGHVRQASRGLWRSGRRAARLPHLEPVHRHCAARRHLTGYGAHAVAGRVRRALLVDHEGCRGSQA
jgi:hypothetical protein